MKLQALFTDAYQIVAVVDGDDCPAQDFLTNREADQQASSSGLLDMMAHIAQNGFQGVPSKWTHEANKNHGIYELIRGRLRLFYFHGKGSQIIVCTGGAVKNGKKANPQEVEKAINYKKDYFKAAEINQLELIE